MWCIFAQATADLSFLSEASAGTTRTRRKSGSRSLYQIMKNPDTAATTKVALIDNHAYITSSQCKSVVLAHRLSMLIYTVPL
ncbi:hypothetical protein EB796_014655 [Bugula neritina]|uniref:Uncharacterized protein n=1 Tax=Bugula neritina TaxID=10212 RepID=A0A7J7JL17_BUGNE|nr:hypothetical protein EB796_014655 [Bugula neritina]